MEEKFMEVKKFVRENPSADINSISTEMEVSVSQIKRWIREERLVFSADSPVGLPCEGCGVSIRTGRLCDKCKNQLSSGLRDAAGLNAKPEEKAAPRRSEKSKMRFLE
jgi:methionyl-tRNA synthetase